MWDLLSLTQLTVTFRLIPTQISLLRKLFPFLKPAGDTEGHPSSYLWSPHTHHDDGVGDSGVVDGPGSHQTGHGRETAALWHTHTSDQCLTDRQQLHSWPCPLTTNPTPVWWPHPSLWAVNNISGAALKRTIICQRFFFYYLCLSPKNKQTNKFPQVLYPQPVNNRWTLPPG